MSTLQSFSHVALAVLLSFATTACAGSTSRAAEKATGTIEGGIQHPAHVPPAMRICAIGGDPSIHVCTRTSAHQSNYRIEGVPPGDYTVIAAAADAVYPVGGHVQQVQCIRAPCPAMPASVTVTAGEVTTGVDLNGFYDKRDDFEAMPVD
jgi:hypothetical protein